MNNEAQSKTIEGKLKVLKAVNNKIIKVELWLLNSEVNRNGWKYINLESHLSECCDIPILTAYVNGKVGDGHNFDIKTDPKTGEAYASFTAADAERIVGWIPKDANIRLEKDDKGIEWIVAEGSLWTYYNHELTSMLKEVGQGGFDISIETLILDEYREADYDVEVKYMILGVTILGQGVQPAVVGATIHTMSALNVIRNGMKTEILKAASYEKSGEEPKQTKTKGVKSKMALSKKQLSELTAKFNGFTAVGATEDMNCIALLSADGAAYGYAVSESDKGVIVNERIEAIPANVTYKINEQEVTVSLDSVLDTALAPIRKELSDAKERAEKAEANNTTLTDELTKSHNRENARRLQAAKDAVTAELNRNNENRAEDAQFSVDICKDLMAKIENNEFTALEDADGNWIGDSAIRKEVSYLCNEERIRMDKEVKANEKRYHNWNLNSSKGDNKPQTLGEKFAASNRN